MYKRYDVKERILIAFALICAVVLVYLLSDDSVFEQLSAGPSQQRIGEIVVIENDVRHKARKGFQWRHLRRTRTLNWGDGVFTGKGSRAIIKLDDGSEIQLQENSLMIFSQTKKDMTLELKFGQFKGTLTEDSHLMVSSAGEMIDLTGKDAKIEIGKSGDDLSMKVVTGEINTRKGAIKAGAVAKIDKQGEVVAVQEKPAETGTPIVRTPAVFKANWKNLVREALIPVDEDANMIGPAKLNLTWENPEPKKKYEIQLSKDPDFKTIVKETLAAGESKDVEVKEAGTYYARVRPEKGSDEQWSTPEEMTVKTGTPPVLPAPDLKKKKYNVDGIAASEAKLEWKKVDRAAEYLVELSKTENFENPIKSVKTKDTNITLNDFSHGKTFARVRAVTPGGRLGAIGDNAQIAVASQVPTIEPIPEIRVLGKTPFAPPEPVELKMKWSESTIAKGYELQISKDAEFSKPMKFKTATPSGALKVKDPGEYHVRVRPLDSESKPLADFSPPQKVNYVYRIPLAQPTLMEPSNNITMFFQTGDAPFYFVWKKVQQADWYIFEVATDPEFKNKLVTQKTTDSRYLYKPTSNIGQIYWRIKAENTERESNWSPTRSIKLFSGRRATE